MIKLTNKTKNELFIALQNEEFLFHTGHENYMNFLNSIWDLKAMPSDDHRFSDAYGDIVQHTINNDDWNFDYLFIERLKLLQDDLIYNKFLETLVSGKYRVNEDEIVKYVLFINSYIGKESYALAVNEYDNDGFPIYTLQKIDDNKHFLDLPLNKIPFFVEKTQIRSYAELTSHKIPDTVPAFVLVASNWDDWSNKTEFGLFYYNTESEGIYIGAIKITDGKNNQTSQIMSYKFLFLSDNFCSLGQSFDYYRNLKKVAGKNFESILAALKDAAFFPDIHETFEQNSIFKDSLIRYDDAERLLRETKHKIYGYDLSNLYSFKYIFTPKYSNESVDVDFNFDSKGLLPSRIFAIIGKNGTGKTQLFTKIPFDISRKNNEFFIPRSPLFSKVIAVSYSIFDDFEIPQKTSSFNYIYCGLHRMNGNKRVLLSLDQQLSRFQKTWRKIKEQGRMQKWRDVLLQFIDEDLINMFIFEEDPCDSDTLTVNTDEFKKVKQKLSSGQSIILFIISEIISHIRLDSLILFDEPETHLHPNAISQLVNTIYDLVCRFQSYCIVTTHSPLIIQELLSRNVYIIEKDENIPSIRKIGIESFGENLTVLTEEVFGNREIPKQYKKIVDRLVEIEQLSYNQIITELESDGIPLSLNARLYIRSKARV